MDIRKKLKLSEIKNEKDLIKIQFISYLRTDFVDRALYIVINKDLSINEIHFHSNDFGTGDWKNGRGVISCNRWETEDEVETKSYLSKHYPAMVLNGPQTEQYFYDKILHDIVSALPDETFGLYINSIVKKDRHDDKFDLSLLSFDSESENLLKNLAESPDQSEFPESHSDIESSSGSIFSRLRRRKK